MAVHGIATRLARGDDGETAWNHHAAAGRVPMVAAIETHVASIVRRTSQGAWWCARVHVSSRPQVINPATAPNDS